MGAWIDVRSFKEGNACWNCRYINKCRPTIRPMHACKKYAPLGEPISHKAIGELLGIDRSVVEGILRQHGADKIIELLSLKGYMLRYEMVGNYVRIYLLK